MAPPGGEQIPIALFDQDWMEEDSSTELMACGLWKVSTLMDLVYRGLKAKEADMGLDVHGEDVELLDELVTITMLGAFVLARRPGAVPAEKAVA